MNFHALDVASSIEDRQAHMGFRPADAVLSAPEPPSVWTELLDFTFLQKKLLAFRKEPVSTRQVVSALQQLFPILEWLKNYDRKMFRSDVLAGLTLASLSIPQSIGYANLAKLDPQYGLYTSFLPPLIYAAMGSSREIAVGPVAVVSLLLSSMVQKVIDPYEDPSAYRKFIFTSTFFAGLFQLAFGFLRLGFLIDFLSHAAIVGFMGGAAIMIGFQQLKGLLGLTHFTNHTDVVSVAKAIVGSLHHAWQPYNFIIGSSFLILILVARYLGRSNKKLFWLPAIAPLVSVVLSTVLVYLTRSNEHGVITVKYVKGGINPISVKQLEFGRPYVGEAAKVGLVSALVALTEAIAVGRSFASINGYQIDGNKEMAAMGVVNLAGSMTSCYVATGSFSRTAVNFSAGCRTAMSNVVMAITVFLAMEFLTRLLYFTPTAILASIILSALPGLIDIGEASRIWRVDKFDFFTCVGAFVGVVFASPEIGLLVAVCISLGKILLDSSRPRMELLGQIPGTDFFCSTKQYPFALEVQGVTIMRVTTSSLCFSNARYTGERIVNWVKDEKGRRKPDNQSLQAVVLDMSNIMRTDTSGIVALEELHKKLMLLNLQLALANPGWEVIHKLKVSKFVDKIGGEWIFLSVAEAVDACLRFKKGTV